MTEEQRALQGWRAGERRKLQSMMAAENIWAFSLSLKKKKDGATWRGEGCEESKNTEEPSTLKGPSGIGG